jgi:hypothetical protein
MPGGGCAAQSLQCHQPHPRPHCQPLVTVQGSAPALRGTLMQDPTGLLLPAQPPGSGQGLSGCHHLESAVHGVHDVCPVIAMHSSHA